MDFRPFQKNNLVVGGGIKKRFVLEYATEPSYVVAGFCRQKAGGGGNEIVTYVCLCAHV